MHSISLRGMSSVRRRDDTDNDEMDQESESDNFSEDSRSSDGSESDESSGAVVFINYILVNCH